MVPPSVFYRVLVASAFTLESPRFLSFDSKFLHVLNTFFSGILTIDSHMYVDCQQ